MSFCCSQCNFSTQFESALTMHRQLHHAAEPGTLQEPDGLQKILADQSMSLDRDVTPTSSVYLRKNKGLKLGMGSRTSSATRILGKLRAKLCRPKVLGTHLEDPLNLMLNADLSSRSECTSKAMKLDSASRTSANSPVNEKPREIYSCHLCSFDADRITVLDRHLLNDHKIGMDSLLKLVLAKTKDSLATEEVPADLFGIRQPYYKTVCNNFCTNDEIIDDGEFVIETVAPKIKILKHTAVNTELTCNEIPDLSDNCRMISKELDRLIKCPSRLERNDLLEKMQTLNEYMCKFVDSSNTLKRVLSRDVESKFSARRDKNYSVEPFFDLQLREPDSPRSPREWERAHSEKLERYRSKHNEKFRCEKSKLSAESYYF